MKKITYLACIGATLSLASPLRAATIDAWEPVSSGPAVPSAVTQSHRTGSGWIGYSNGQVYFTSNAGAAVPAWQRMDQGSNMGHPFDMGFTHAVTVIATADSYDDYIAYVGFNSDKYYSELWRAVYNGGGIHWDNVSGAGLVELEGVSINPLDTERLYVATTSSVRYSFDMGATWQTSDSDNPLTPPSGCAVSAIASNRESSDQVLVGCTDGQVWVVWGARVGAPSWVRIDNSSYAGLPDRMITRLQIDQTDTSGKTFLAVLAGNSTDAVWITRNGGQWWQAAASPIVSGGAPSGQLLSASLCPGPATNTLYAELVGFGSIRSDDGGQTWFTTPRWSGFNLAVEYKHYDRDPVSSQLMPIVRVQNLGSVTVPASGLRFQYLFTPEGDAAQTYWCDWSPMCTWTSSGCSNIIGMVDGGLLEIVVGQTSATVAPDQASGEIQGRVAKSDWTAYDQSNDLSFISDAYDWRLNRHVQLHDAQGRWLWGTFVP